MSNRKNVSTNTRSATRATIINALLLVTGTYGLYKCTMVHLPPTLNSAGHKQFLTNISLAISLVYNLLTLLTRGHSRVVEEYVFPVSLILETVVALVYWPLKIFFVHLIYQQSANPLKKRGTVLPLHVDMCLHLFPSVGLLFQYLFLRRSSFSLSKRKVFLVCILLGTVYKWYLQILVKPELGAKYPYPFLDISEPWKSIVMYTVTLIAWGCYVGLQNLKRHHRGLVHKRATARL